MRFVLLPHTCQTGFSPFRLWLKLQAEKSTVLHQFSHNHVHPLLTTVSTEGECSITWQTFLLFPKLVFNYIVAGRSLFVWALCMGSILSLEIIYYRFWLSCHDILFFRGLHPIYSSWVLLGPHSHLNSSWPLHQNVLIKSTSDLQISRSNGYLPSCILFSLLAALSNWNIPSYSTPTQVSLTLATPSHFFPLTSPSPANLWKLVPLGARSCPCFPLSALSLGDFKYPYGYKHNGQTPTLLKYLSNCLLNTSHRYLNSHILKTNLLIFPPSSFPYWSPSSP